MLHPDGSSMQLGLMAWFPDARSIVNDLVSPCDPVQILLMSGNQTHWKEMRLNYEPESAETSFFVGSYWAEASKAHWEIPIISVVVYIMMIPLLKAYIEKNGKWNVRSFAFYWNAGLSIFSCFGVLACVPPLLLDFFRNGFYFTCCAPPNAYSSGFAGLFLVLFIYSKLFELIDTLLLMLAGKPLLALQWWHHSTVLLYCWHSHTSKIATGAWFACMNYSVHSVMYGYFAITGTKYRKMVSPYAIYITIFQLVQMLVGMFVTIKAVIYQASGEECHVNKTNSILGLAMYASYFVLFAKLFVDNYCLSSSPHRIVNTTDEKMAQPAVTEQPSNINRIRSMSDRVRSTSQDLSRKLSTSVFDDEANDIASASFKDVKKEN